MCAGFKYRNLTVSYTSYISKSLMPCSNIVPNVSVTWLSAAASHSETPDTRCHS